MSFMTDDSTEWRPKLPVIDTIFYFFTCNKWINLQNFKWFWQKEMV